METNQQHITNLLERCKKADKNAQMAIYKAYYHAMYNVSYRILNDPYEAEDMMQEAFLAAFTKLSSYKGEVTFGAWLKKIVVNKSLTQLKKNNRYNEVKLEIVHEQEEETVESINYNDLQPKKVMLLLDRLKDNYKMVLNLNLIEGYDYEEIAEILNYTNENVRTTISRAKKKLKQLIVSEQQNRTYVR